MKKNIHPQTYPVVFIDGEHRIVSRSTQKSERTIDIDGVPHYVINIEISSFTHPLYTGEKRFVDTQGQVNKFQTKQKYADELRQKLVERKKKREEKKQIAAKTLKDLLGNI
ncbi:50S ribosomal protein L31 [Candidatus Roizmanbacteria bacterium RIFCSPLOWO2_01_FULL_42_14]|uniref:50S ribosomal protein L31 n=3 Tax=Candidatus Roizmaniibacteriota TaxID=1752723 RepID=A0A1F7J8V4_9BACT|nr:MAG: 50S ribosomal protein L31 [Candidatus Roizmanbacteria bacterium RIFCSPHIGHO2_02_FULL_43_11]OGK37633.1 MAG: 50S ribosomal protein L31 [Candidatus Roizmanbacteria bacterium RIFCSPHIGHO2_12_FULL_42_10]OGK52044.1 MAG: 50S ribosomal protein L31 [Candidatus Roizmanbacteria bacterium RIFCSPLOWO2_01_FULL_42_14]